MDLISAATGARGVGVAPPPGRLAEPADFRAACAQFATGVVVVTASADGRDFGGTVNSFTSLTLSPPQVLVCLAATSTTWTAVERSGRFAVNVLAADQLELAKLFASKQPDKLAGVAHERGVLGAPLLAGALATFECAVAEAVPRATHVMIIGRVARVRTDETKPPAVFFRSVLREGHP